MKKHLLAATAFLYLSGCAGEDPYNSFRETRYFAYIGEPVAVLYENFGTPFKGIKYSDTERALVFHTQDFDREWSFIDYRYCDITFYLNHDIVTGWEMDGNQCAINEASGSLFDGWFGDNASSGISTDAFGDANYGMRELMNARDMFGNSDYDTAPASDAFGGTLLDHIPTHHRQSVSNMGQGHIIANDVFDVEPIGAGVTRGHKIADDVF